MNAIDQMQNTEILGAELATVVRSGFIESRHRGILTAINPAGEPVISLGETKLQIFPRSTVKLVQALACLRLGAPLADQELALAAASHRGQDFHLVAARSILAKAGLSESDLGCPPDWSGNEQARNAMLLAGISPSPIRMNCSGKHSAMLLTCAVNGWPTGNYLDASHPLQRAIVATFEELTGEPVQHIGVDGCGAPLLSITVPAIARVFRRFALAEPGSYEHAVRVAMQSYPEYVAGTKHENTESMLGVTGLIAKGGAEGVIGMATADGAAVAMKILDGNHRATTFIALKVLESFGADLSNVQHLVNVPVLGGGRPVGQLELGSDLASAL